MVAGAGRAELDRGNPDAQKRHGVRGPVAPDAGHAGRVMAGRRAAEGAHVNGIGVDGGRGAREGRDHLCVIQRPDLAQDLGRVLLGQVADIHVDVANVWHLIQGAIRN